MNNSVADGSGSILIITSYTQLRSGIASLLQAFDSEPTSFNALQKIPLCPQGSAFLLDFHRMDHVMLTRCSLKPGSVAM